MSMFAFILILPLHSGMAQDLGTDNSSANILSLPLFLNKAISHDPSFPVLLSDELYLKFQKDLLLPAGDIVLGVSAQYDLFLPLEENQDGVTPWEGSISLSKLFPSSGTKVEAAYSNSLFSTGSGAYHRSSAGVMVSQPIVQNAFGVLTRMQENKIEIDENIVRYRVVEAYEEYMASLIEIYIEWYLVTENAGIARNNLKHNRDLATLVMRKRRYGIARPEDVYRMELEVIQSQESLEELESQLLHFENKIRRLTGIAQENGIIPEKPTMVISAASPNTAESILQKSRTFRILKDAEKSAAVNLDIAGRSILPEVNLFMGYKAIGRDYNIQDRTENAYAGVSGQYNFGHAKENADEEIKGIDLKRARLETRRTLFNLEIYASELESAIRLQETHIARAKDRLSLSEKILAAETNNYSIGKKSLNDLILARKSVETARYDIVNMEMSRQILILERQKTLDLLVDKIQR